MEEVLQSIFVHVDASSKTLANNAIAQLVIKLLYNCGDYIKKEELARMIDSQTHMDISKSDSFDTILNSLVGKKEILQKKGSYYLSTSKKEKIRKSIDDSKERIERLLENFFNRLYSDKEIIKAWFQDVTIKFFGIYADIWISDLLAGSQLIRNFGESVRSTIENRTKSFKNLDSRDIAELPERFFKFVTTRHPDVDAYLWEHGTSRFSALLISNRQGVDKLTLDSFSNSTCILDTNVLIFIALSTKSNVKTYEQIERAFEQLGISVNVLNITKSEYEHRIDIQRDATIKNIERGKTLATKIPNDSFTQCAIERQCSSKEDFELFFEMLRKLPTFVANKLKIELLDNDTSMDKVIEKAQKDEGKKENLKRIYRTQKNREKMENATIHDVGLIEGAEFLRKRGKYFILSEETSVNAYSQNKPTENGLPISIRVDTLLNILVANGNTMTDSSDYISLYADLIRLDLIPAEKTFTQCQLYQMCELNNRISKLPVGESERIAWAAHEKMVHGVKDEELRLFINDRITESEISLKEEVARQEDELTNYKEELKLASKHNKKYRDALTEQWHKEIKRKLLVITICRMLAIPFIILLIGGIIAFVLFFLNEGTTGIVALCISIFATFIVELFYLKCKWFKDSVSFFRRKDEIVAQEVYRKLEELDP